MTPGNSGLRLAVVGGRSRAIAALLIGASCSAPNDPNPGAAGSGDGSGGAVEPSPEPPDANDGDDASTQTTGSASTGEADEPGTTGAAQLGPPYPIVLAHGFFGFDELADLDFATYFYEVPEALADAGETNVFVTAVDPFNDSTVRGEELLAQVEEIVASTGHAKVVILGHSQGGLDARVVASLRPDLVAAVVTFATPHHGTPIADIVLGLVDDPAAQGLIDALVGLLGVGLWDTVDGETSLADAMWQFSQPGITAFNATYPDAAGVRYVSITGRSSLSLGGGECDVPAAPAFIADWAPERDPIDPLFSPFAAVLSQSVFDPVPNDGLVRVADAKWGEFLGCVPADHMDQVGHLFGDLPGLTNAWRHRPFYVDLVAWIRAEGL